MNLGWLDVCLRVESASKSRRFYEDLGFARVEGDDTEGWAVMVHGESRIGLYESQYMSDAPVMLNFRGGDVEANVGELIARGHALSAPLVTTEQGGASAKLVDPDGYLIFLDTAPGETKRIP